MEKVEVGETGWRQRRERRRGGTKRSILPLAPKPSVSSCHRPKPVFQHSAQAIFPSPASRSGPTTSHHVLVFSGSFRNSLIFIERDQPPQSFENLPGNYRFHPPTSELVWRAIVFPALISRFIYDVIANASELFCTLEKHTNFESFHDKFGFMCVSI